VNAALFQLSIIGVGLYQDTVANCMSAVCVWVIPKAAFHGIHSVMLFGLNADIEWDLGIFQSSMAGVRTNWPISMFTDCRACDAPSNAAKCPLPLLSIV